MLEVETRMLALEFVQRLALVSLGVVQERDHRASSSRSTARVPGFW